MKKTTETYYCDCCGKQFDRFRNKYRLLNVYNKVRLVFPYLVDNEDIESIKNENDIVFSEIEINDICDNCMEKIIEFSNKLFTRLNEV